MRSAADLPRAIDATPYGFASTQAATTLGACAPASLGAEVVKKHFVKNVDALGEHHGAVYLPTQLYKESSDPHALIEARRKSSEPSSVKKARKPAAKKPARKPAAKRARDSSDDSSDGEVIHATSAADRAARRKSSNESAPRGPEEPGARARVRQGELVHSARQRGTLLSSVHYAPSTLSAYALRNNERVLTRINECAQQEPFHHGEAHRVRFPRIDGGSGCASKRGDRDSGASFGLSPVERTIARKPLIESWPNRRAWVFKARRAQSVAGLAAAVVRCAL